ncbi:MAG: C40 family peptidase [Candidatus Nanopelagicales bacterium]
MALLSRVRTVVLSGSVALAVALPVLPGTISPATAAPVTTTVSSAAKSSVATRRSTPSSSRAAVRARAVLAVGYRYRGVPYRYGGSSPSGFDCSGFTAYVVRKATGRSLAHSASAQRRATTYVSRSNARAGDLVFFSRGGRVYHVGIYAGNNRVLHAPRTGRRVSTERIWTRSVSFGRV